MARFELKLMPVKANKAGEYEGSEKKVFWHIIDDTTTLDVLRPRSHLSNQYEDYLTPATHMTVAINDIWVQRVSGVVRKYRVLDLRDYKESA